MKKKIKIFSFILALFSFITFFSFNIKNVNANEDKIYLGGMPAGFSLNTVGVTVVGLCDVITTNGSISPSKIADVRVGDRILSIDHMEINNALDIEKAIKDKTNIIINIKRDKTYLEKEIKLEKDLTGNNKLGVFIKDDICGIGTITFIKGNRFASLGHPVLDENGELIEINGGEIYNCNITGCVKGERGKAGELRGAFIKNNSIGKIEKNLSVGVYGSLNEKFDFNNLTEITIGEATIGDAEIYSTIHGESPRKYKINIIKTENKNESKNFVIKICDRELLDKTNGIVQGMSGSPIIQNGKLVGAVTHVFINDPTRGFGLSIFNMINN